nr:IS66 family transposase [Ruminiclostridium sufflavum]
MRAPLYRQEQDFRRYGICLSRQTMSNWLLKCSED